VGHFIDFKDWFQKEQEDICVILLYLYLFSFYLSICFYVVNLGRGGNERTNTLLRLLVAKTYQPLGAQLSYVLLVTSSSFIKYIYKIVSKSRCVTVTILYIIHVFCMEYIGNIQSSNVQKKIFLVVVLSDCVFGCCLFQR
jgi:hypothetical protein